MIIQYSITTNIIVITQYLITTAATLPLLSATIIY